MRTFLHIGYKGTNYHGWQRQPNVISIQQIIEEHLSKMLHKEITVVGCGRTDAGVHASQYFLHFDFTEPFDYDIVFRLNKMLPDDIVIFESIEVDQNAHTQYDATHRTYQYLLHFKKDPFLHDISSYYDLESIDFEKMTEAVNLISNYKNFRSFCKSPDIYKHTNCEIRHAKLFLNKNQDRMRIEICSNRFVRGMIRLLVLRLIEIGKGKLDIETFKSYLSATVELPFKTYAYPQGLYLSKVVYPYLNKESTSLFYDVERLGNDAWEQM